VARGWTTAYEFCSGKVPLRLIQRVGLLLSGGVPLLGWAFFEAKAIVALRDAASTSILALCLMLLLTLFWSLLALPMGRMVWAALTAPSQRDGGPTDFES
jgi:hypothetical protein